MTDPVVEYRRRFQRFLSDIAGKLESHVQAQLRGVARIDRITARAKDPERFAQKAAQVNDDGEPKYARPLTEIQDQLGVRVIVLYRDDVDATVAAVTRYYEPIEERDLVPESQWAFGYFGRHLVLPVPRDVIPAEIDVGDVPRFFELQIKTLFQHAWSEANHDLGYKSNAPLSSDQQRRLAYTAAQAWGADRVFTELWTELRRELGERTRTTPR
jgi:ppGpp synthetase/RelA/SpoT-type nucleotidyltranferase